MESCEGVDGHTEWMSRVDVQVVERRFFSTSMEAGC